MIGLLTSTWIDANGRVDAQDRLADRLSLPVLPVQALAGSDASANTLMLEVDPGTSRV